MSQSRIQVVFFDAADTLFHIQAIRGGNLSPACGAPRLSQTPDSLAAIKAAFARLFSRRRRRYLPRRNRARSNNRSVCGGSISSTTSLSRRHVRSLMSF